MKTIFIKILNEDVDVWRPVKVSKTNIPDVWYIELPPVNIVPEDESWEFSPGMLITLKEIISDGKSIMIAINQVI